MENFKFSLEKILTISLDEEKQAKETYEGLLFDLGNLKIRLEAINEQIVQNSGIKNIEDISQIHLKRNYIYSLETQKEELLKEIDIKNRELDGAYTIYIDKQIDKQMLETMKDEELREYTLSVDLEEQAKNDEFAIYSYVKNNRG